MKTPIKAGDLCEVIGGLTGEHSPNLGLIVKVLTLRGQHSMLGNIWRCEAQYAVLGQEGTKPGPPGTADFSQDWLRKIEPPAQTTQINVFKEVTA